MDHSSRQGRPPADAPLPLTLADLQAARLELARRLLATTLQAEPLPGPLRQRLPALVGQLARLGALVRDPRLEKA
jgi:hypothetical protein